jgi:hypothetical protein
VIDTFISEPGLLGVAGQIGFPSTTVYRFVNVIPEPSTALLIGLGLVGLGARRRRS